jgi:hypothetical protein
VACTIARAMNPNAPASCADSASMAKASLMICSTDGVMVVFFMASGVVPLSVSVQVSIYDDDLIFLFC